MSTILDLAVALSLKDMISGQLGKVINDFKNLEGITDGVKNQLNTLKNIGIGGGILAGAGLAGLKATANALTDCMDAAATFEDSMTVLMNKSFGKNIVDPAYKKDVALTQKALSNLAMDIAGGTTFNGAGILDSMTALVKGGITKDELLNFDEETGDNIAKANAYFAQVNRVSAESTAEGTAQMKTGFRLVGKEIMDAMEYVNKFADTTIADSLALQRALGGIAGAASTIWEGRDRVEIAKDTILLTALTTNLTGDERSASTYARNFLSRANMEAENMSERQYGAMLKANWLDDQGRSVFIDYEKGMLKDIYQLERILKEGKARLSNVEFANVLRDLFQEQGSKAAQILAEIGNDIDLSVLLERAENTLSIEDQVTREMNRFNAVKDMVAENWMNLKTVIGEPFLEPAKNILKGLSEVIKILISYFREHPEVTKFIFALAGGVSAFLLVTGTIMGLISAIGSLKIILNVAGSTILSSMTPVIGVMLSVMAVVAVLAGIAFVVYKNWDTLKPMFQSIIDKIVILFNILKNNFKKFVDATKPVIKEVFGFFEGTILNLVENAMPLIEKGLDFIINILQGNFKEAFNIAKQFINSFFESMGVSSEKTKSRMLMFSNGFKTAISIIPSILSTLFNVIVTIFSAIINFISKNSSNITNIIIIAWNAVSKFVFYIIKFISSIIVITLNGVKDFINKWGSTIVKIFTTGFQILLLVVQKIIEKVTKWMPTILGIFKFILGAVQIVVQMGFNVIKNIIGFILGIILNMVKFFLTIIQGDWKTAWESLGLVAQVLIIILGPSILAVTAYLLGLKAVMLATTVIASIKAMAIAGISIAMGIWRGIVATATLIQTVWNVAMHGGTLATIGQKIALAALLPIIALVKGATIIWTVVQGALNTAFWLCPIFWIIAGIVALIAVVALVVTHFKDIVEWVKKAWNALKEFLGFKRDSKDELQEPITTTIVTEEVKTLSFDTSNIDKNIGVGIDFDTSKINKNSIDDIIKDFNFGSFDIPIEANATDVTNILGFKDDINKLIKGYGTDIGSVDVPIEANTDDFLALFGSKENMNKYLEAQGLTVCNIDVPLDINTDNMMSILGSEDGMKKYLEEAGLGNTNIDFSLGVDSTELTEQLKTVELDMGANGLNSSLEFSNGFGSEQSKSAMADAVRGINDTIHNNLIHDDNMRTWGGNLIQSFINGIESKKSLLQQTVGELASTIGDYMKVMSPTKKGALSTNHLWGGNLIESFANGMKNNIYSIKNAVELASDNIANISKYRINNDILSKSNIENQISLLNNKTYTNAEVTEFGNLKNISDNLTSTNIKENISLAKNNIKSTFDMASSMLASNFNKRIINESSINDYKLGGKIKSNSDDNNNKVINIYVYASPNQNTDEIVDKVVKIINSKTRSISTNKISGLTMSPYGYKGGF